MKKNIINFEKLMEESKAKDISVYLLVKRELLYRKSGDTDLDRKCKNCRASQKIKYKDGWHLQCSWIGIIKDDYSDIKLDHVCKFYERAYHKILNNEGVVRDETI